ncbi:hypothetical protein [Paenibacillus sp. UNC451MF]|uniref:hypothetical protein n=1 Tax=Paenibacillus sp. UNC451MF TaxID=1449063 RepID=UPI000560DEE0|nr:hypothetical protein [Paenibacillus sp. UNC451MF]
MAWTEAVSRVWNILKDHKPSLYPMEEWDELHDIRVSKLSTDGVESSSFPYALAVKAGLYLLNESLDKSHSLSQEIHNSTGSYWHGIMHRMEGDYSNAKYWFRQAGLHPVQASMLAAALEAYKNFDLDSIESPTLKNKLEALVSGASWDAYLFADIVEQQVTVVQDDLAEELLTELQWIEIKLLIQYSYQQSGGNSLEL